ncbi:MAG: hypothetical protein AB7D50_00035 [Bacilli bacterium]
MLPIEIYKQIVIFLMFFVLAFAMTKFIYLLIAKKLISLFIVPILLFIISLTLLIIGVLIKSNQIVFYQLALLSFISTLGSLLATLLDIHQKKYK